MAKMDKKWVILCSTAVAAVYATGFFSTEAQAVKMDAAPPQPQMSKQTKVAQSNISITKPNITTVAPAQPKPNKTIVAPVQPKQMYKDGVFTGMGMNRRGEIKVAVTLQEDKITDVQISNWGMHYSERDVTALPGEVLQKQNANVNNVSGATYSTQAFSGAVQEALNQALNS